jgi:hypothetical protein
VIDCDLLTVIRPKKAYLEHETWTFVKKSKTKIENIKSIETKIERKFLND